MDGNYLQPATKYDSAEWTSGIVTDYDVSAQTLFVNCLNPKRVVIRADQAVTIKFNSTSDPAITVSASTEFDLIFQFQKLYVTTTVATALKILFLE